jgi:LuxR family maltose regulon positive regulatory protein
MDTPILLSKLHIPKLRREFISRPRLLRLLDQGTNRKLTIISSPAGFGKTTLLSEWVPITGLPAGWVSLDEEDNDLIRFLTYLVAALKQVDENVDDTTLSLMRSPQPVAVSAALTALLNQIDRFPDDFLIVLDDYHLIEDKSIHRAVDFILNHLPTQMHLVLVTRADPPLQLARLRGQGQMTELRMSDLRFSQDEAQEFFGKFFPSQITMENINILCRRTEGWITGLQMAAISMQGKEDFGEFVRSFSGSHRYILDYLIEEVLQQLPEEVVEFLYQTSILERLNGPLCDAVTGREDCHQILDHLEKANLFIFALDDARLWFRYHRLFSDLLQFRLQQNLGSQIPALHLNASIWYEQNGWESAAIDHALAAEDFERAITLLEDEAEETLMHSEISTFLRWIGKLPPSLITERPNINFLFAWGQMIMGHDFDEVLERISKIEDSHGWLVGRKATLQAFIAVSLADMNEGEKHASQAMKLLQEEDVYFRSIAMWILGVSRASRHNLEEAGKVLKELLELCQTQGNTMFMVMTAGQLARIHHRMGNLVEAENIYGETLEMAQDRQGNLLPIAGEAMMGLGELYLELNELDKAADHILEGIELTLSWREAAAMEGYVSLAWVKGSQGDWDAAQDAMDKAMELAIEYDVIDIDDRMVEMWQARLWMLKGELDLAEAWAKDLKWKTFEDLEKIKSQDNLSYHLFIRESVIITRLKYLKGQYTEALKWLDRQISIFKDLDRLNAVTELYLLKALAYDGLGDKGKAMAELKNALEIGQQAGFLRTFLNEGTSLKPLLQRARAQNVFPEYIDRLFAGMDEPVTEIKIFYQPLIDPLTERELEVLRLLPTNLTTPEIAEEMMIGVNTVRTHIKNIYSKLNVHKRSEAANRAHKLGLL